MVYLDTGIIHLQRKLVSALQDIKNTPDVLVVYDSWTGNTEQIANAIAKGLGTTAIKVKDEPPTSPQLLVIGSPVHFGATNRILEYLEIANPDSMAIFLTYGAIGKLAEVTIKKTIMQMKKPGVQYLGSFICKGYHPILQLHHFHPDQNDLINAEQFGEQIKKNYYGSQIPDSQGLGNDYLMIPWINQNLPFACGISQGIQQGFAPNKYEQDPANWRSSKKWFTRGYYIGQKYRESFL